MISFMSKLLRSKDVCSFHRQFGPGFTQLSRFLDNLEKTAASGFTRRYDSYLIYSQTREQLAPGFAKKFEAVLQIAKRGWETDCPGEPPCILTMYYVDDPDHKGRQEAYLRDFVLADRSITRKLAKV